MLHRDKRKVKAAHSKCGVNFLLFLKREQKDIIFDIYRRKSSACGLNSVTVKNALLLLSECD